MPCGPPATAEDALFVSKRITPPDEYTSGIEGPAVDASGNLYVVNFGQQRHHRQAGAGAGKSQLFTSLPAGSIGNGMRFDREGRMYVADYKKHNVWVITAGETTPSVYFHSDRFNQPNDLAIAADGTLYASDPHLRRLRAARSGASRAAPTARARARSCPARDASASPTDSI